MKEAMRMTQEIFKRYEKKYMLTQKQHDALIPVLERRMKADHYGEHTISNIYFDTRDYELVRKSIEKPEYKEKLRLRAYGKVTDNGVVYAELKKKFDGGVYKRRIPMTHILTPRPGRTSPMQPFSAKIIWCLKEMAC